MTIGEFSVEVAPTLQLGVATLGLVSLLLLWYQIRQATKWNRVTTHYALLQYLPKEEQEGRVIALLERHGISRDAEKIMLSL